MPWCVMDESASLRPMGREPWPWIGVGGLVDLLRTATVWGSIQ
jgi:hypothetical protein